MTIRKILSGTDGVASAAAVLLGFLAATLIILLIGRNPSAMYQAILQVVSGFDIRRGTWNTRYIGEWLVSSVPLVLCGFSFGAAARAGLFNIGAEGQYIAGLTAAQIIALYFPPVPVIHWLAAICGALIAGAVWGGIAGFFKARYKVSEVVATIMMNYIALYIHRLITLGISGSNTFKTPDFSGTAVISSRLLSSITNGSRLNNGLWLTIAVVLIYWLIMEKTALGFSMRASGLNRDAALYAGIHVKANMTAAMTFAGAFAGLAGALVSLGVFSYGRILAGFDGYGFDGIAVSLTGNGTAAGIALAGLLFGMLKSAQPLMQLRQIPKEITSIIMGLVVVFISLRTGLRLLARQPVVWGFNPNKLFCKRQIKKKIRRENIHGEDF
ncbi:MAG: ABC transporter permease [Treponema sp.]|nr:ABC transporter permease [Treponema sp.]